MEEEAREGQSVYLRGWGDYLRYSLKLTESPQAGLGHMALRAWSPEALERRVAAIEEAGLGTGWIDGDVGHGPAYRFTDPDGHVFELYYEAERYVPPEHLKPSWRNQPQRYVGRGAAVKRLDHVNVLAADVRANRVFAEDVLGYRLYERIERDDGTEGGAWMSLSIAAHELIYVADAHGARGRLHHLAFWVDTREECLRAADLFVDNERSDRGGALEARRRAGLLPLRLRAGREPDRGDDGRLLRLRPGLRADRLDAGGARPWPVLGRADDRELPHVRHTGRGGEAVIDSARFEILPFGKGEQEAQELPELVWLTVTASPTHTLDDTVDVASRLRGLGHSVTPHLAARMVREPRASRWRTGGALGSGRR